MPLRPKTNTIKTERQHKLLAVHCCLNCICGFFRSYHFFGFWKVAMGATSLAATSFLAILQFTDVREGQNLQGVPPWVGALAEDIWNHRFVVSMWLVGATIVATIGFGISALIHSVCVKNLDIIKKVLEEAVTEHFENRSNGHTYRGTLFRAFSCPFLGSWLGIVQRSADVYVMWRSIFCIDAQVQKNCTGIAGECWWNAQAQLNSKFYGLLPPLEDAGAINPAYLDKGFLDQRELNRAARKSVFFHATEIRVNGKVWGVLILDSTDPTAIGTTKAKMNKHDSVVVRAASEITRLLE